MAVVFTAHLQVPPSRTTSYTSIRRRTERKFGWLQVPTHRLPIVIFRVSGQEAPISMLTHFTSITGMSFMISNGVPRASMSAIRP